MRGADGAKCGGGECEVLTGYRRPEDVLRGVQRDPCWIYILAQHDERVDDADTH
jgi:hypothetical protein